MAHMINVTSIDNEIMEMDEPEDAQFSIISHARALVSPNEKEYDLISRKVDQLMQEGRGECIFEVGLGSDPPAGMQNLKLKFSKTKAKNCLVESNKSIARYFSFIQYS